jgi:putative ATP-dependent endonuclease of OLD family
VRIGRGRRDMKINALTIRNFKSIRELHIDDIDSALIVVGKNSTGKTAILDAVLAVAGLYTVSREDFNLQESNIEVEVLLEITESDLAMLNRQGMISKYKRYDIWFSDFCEKLPSYQNGVLSFTFVANKDGKVRYWDGVRKNNKYIPMVLPKIHFIDYSRNLQEIQDDIFLARSRESLSALRENRCMFDQAKRCTDCFQCIGVIEKKSPADLTVFETTKLLEYKLVHMDMSGFVERLNQNFQKNSGLGHELMYMLHFDVDQILKIDMAMYHEARGSVTSVQSMSEGIKSIYVLSLLETYIEEGNRIPSIIMIEDPETYLHPQLQKAASEILYRLSRENQVIFSTHSPNMIFNFNSRQIRQVVLDQNYNTVVREHADIDRILDDLGYTAGDLLNVSFVFIVEGKQDRNRLPLLLDKYYSEIYDEDGMLQRIAILSTNSCTNIKTYANLKYMNKLYIRDQFLMIRDGDGRDREELVDQLCGYYRQREKEDLGSLPRVRPENVLVLKYYSFENYFLDPEVMAAAGILSDPEEFYDILFEKYNQYLYKLKSFQNLTRMTGVTFDCKEDLREHMELIRIYGRGHNLFDIFYGRYKGKAETDILKKYIDLAPRKTFSDILDSIDSFVYFDSRRKGDGGRPDRGVQSGDGSIKN